MEALKLIASHFTPPGFTAGGQIGISSLTGSSDAFLALALAGEESLVLAITPGIPDAERLADDLRLIPSSVRVLEFPPALEGERAALATRLKTYAALRARALSPYPCVIVAAYAALSTSLPATVCLPIELKPGSKTLGELTTRLAEAGYTRVPAVLTEGDYSVRGGIVDAWSPGEEFPVRAEFFGDDLESLRSFNAATQRSVARLDSAELYPIREKVAEADSKPLTLIDLLPDETIFLALDHNLYGPLAAPARLKRGRVIYTGDPAPRGVPTYNFAPSSLPGFAELGSEDAHHPELFDRARQSLERHLAAARARGDLVLRIDELSGGFEIPGLLVVTKSDRVFTRRKIHTPRRAAISSAQLEDFDDLEPGEYVVHVDYGVGRFLGSSEIQLEGKRSEVFTIEYADGALLHVPAAHAHLLSRYIGVKGEAVPLHRLDGKRWTKDRLAAQKAVNDLAAVLLETQARREAAPGFAYDIACDGYAAFTAAFPYEETADQLAAIRAVENDLAAPRPMDRLICGDAGYGKTEVAMRAAYIAALNGKQTAVLAPTTVLAEQHFETFTSRFDGTPVRIESVSRFQSDATHKGTFARLKNGACDIVIGTHAILSSRIAFHDLGLIIIDEEQRFGVRHKEFLKRLRATADVLTLSATPIPRTLYLSMTGARDLSLLRTPPRERVAVETRVVRDSDLIVRTAIEAELARGGQIFFLHNRVSTLSRVEKRLHEILPQLRLVVAHGQMDAATLARKMRAFERGEYDLLLSTTIIESGIDIPRANTILVDHAEMFGLADLYQLRGRVGRAARAGRALFLLPPDGIVDSDARERLDALLRHGGLGAGYNLAVRDLELRGAGNLLGSEQSGHIASVGFTLYCQLLKRTVAHLKGETMKEIVDVQLNLDFIDMSPASENTEAAAAIPYSYIEEDAQRMAIMKRLAEAQDIATVQQLSEELVDRYGPIPIAARRLLRLTQLRVRMAHAGYASVNVKDTRATFYDAATRSVACVHDLPKGSADRKISSLLRVVRAPRS